MLDTIEGGFNRLTIYLAVLVAASIGLITLLIPLNLVLVKSGVEGIWWLFEGVEYALYFGLFLGAPWVLQENAHVKVDLFVTALSENSAAKLDTLLNVIGFLLCCLLCVYGVRSLIEEFIAGTMPDKDVRIANWIVLIAFVASFVMLAIEFLFRMRPDRLLDRQKAARRGEHDVSEAGF